MDCLFAMSTECSESLFLRGSLKISECEGIQYVPRQEIRVGMVQSSTEGTSLITTIKRFRVESSQQFEVFELY